MSFRLRTLLSAFGFALVSSAMAADEGMWTFDNLPLKKMVEKFGFAPDKAWLDHAQLSAVNFGGASASFISSNGLVITNHHVGRGSIQRLSTAENNYLNNGFIARTMAEEIRVLGLTLRTVVQMENVTDAVNAAVRPTMKPNEAAEARQKAFAALADDLAKKTGLEARQVSLYRGGEYWVYLNKVHTDVRLVAAPELQAGAFGGDPDNFTYPRHDLDFSMFRVYENDKPYTPPHFLKLPSSPLKAGDLTFVIGFPGSTSRQLTYAQMCFNRDYSAPASIANTRARREAILAQIAAAKTDEERRVAMNPIFGVENSLKATEGYFRGLLDVPAMARIKKAEDELRAKINSDAALKMEAGDSFAKIEESVKLQISVFKEQQAMSGFNGELVGRLATIVGQANSPQPASGNPRAAAQQNQARERAVAEFAFDKAREITALAAALDRAAKELPSGHSFRRTVIGSKSSLEVATSAVEGTQMASADARKALQDGGKAAIAASKDPLLAIVRQVQDVQAAVSRVQSQARAIVDEQAPRIAKARFAVYGKDIYPDATGTLRLTYGAVESYDAGGTKVQPFTTFYGLYDRHAGWGGNEAKAVNGVWTLPERWLERKDSLDLGTPLNFIHTVDTIGGNSGSPVLNTKGEIVGLLFDGVYESLQNNYYYSESDRSVSVDIRAVIEALNKVYDASHLVGQMGQ
jgi:hypothetical protein